MNPNANVAFVVAHLVNGIPSTRTMKDYADEASAVAAAKRARKGGSLYIAMTGNAFDAARGAK